MHVEEYTRRKFRFPVGLFPALTHFVDVRKLLLCVNYWVVSQFDLPVHKMLDREREIY